MMNREECSYYRKAIIDVVYNEEEKEVIINHINSCQECKKYYDDIVSLRGIEYGKEVSPQDEFESRRTINRIVNRVEEHRKKRKAISDYFVLLAVCIIYFTILFVMMSSFGTAALIVVQVLIGVYLPLLILFFSKYKRIGERK